DVDELFGLVVKRFVRKVILDHEVSHVVPLGEISHGAPISRRIIDAMVLLLWRKLTGGDCHAINSSRQASSFIRLGGLRAMSSPANNERSYPVEGAQANCCRQSFPLRSASPRQITVELPM